jgi:hypothetical protein
LTETNFQRRDYGRCARARHRSRRTAAVSSSANICSATGRVSEASRSIEAWAEEARWTLEAFFAKVASSRLLWQRPYWSMQSAAGLSAGPPLRGAGLWDKLCQ